MAAVLHFEVVAWIATSLLKTIKEANDVYDIKVSSVVLQLVDADLGPGATTLEHYHI